MKSNENSKEICSSGEILPLKGWWEASDWSRVRTAEIGRQPTFNIPVQWCPRGPGWSLYLPISCTYVSAEPADVSCPWPTRNLSRRSPIKIRRSLMLKSLISCNRISRDAPIGNRWCRILLMTGGAISSARDKAASFFKFNFSMTASNTLFGSYPAFSKSEWPLIVIFPALINIWFGHPTLGSFSALPNATDSHSFLSVHSVRKDWIIVNWAIFDMLNGIWKLKFYRPKSTWFPTATILLHLCILVKDVHQTVIFIASFYAKIGRMQFLLLFG